MPRSVPRPNSTAWIRLPARLGQDLIDVVIGHAVGIGEEEDDLGPEAQGRAQGQHVVGAAVGADGFELVLDPRLVRRSWPASVPRCPRGR